MLTVLLPEEIEEADIRKMMEQVEEACSRFHIQVMGGHTEVTRAVNQPVISVTGVGKVRRTGWCPRQARSRARIFW